MVYTCHEECWGKAVDYRLVEILRKLLAGHLRGGWDIIVPDRCKGYPASLLYIILFNVVI
jgi:hypothetical protein